MAVDIARMFEFAKDDNGSVVISNRIFETLLYDFFHLKMGYMLSYDFNQKKEIGVKEVQYGDCTLVEAVV